MLRGAYEFEWRLSSLSYPRYKKGELDETGWGSLVIFMKFL
jgi:hypothetical protein